jgi:hypothetical protein
MKRIAMSLFVVLCGLLLVVPAQATPVSLNDVVTVKDWGPGGGGEILYYNYTANSYFTTFCLEKGVYIYPGYDYQITNISNNVISGGAGATTLNAETKWLFYQWAMGTLSGYNQYGEEALQQAIWYFQSQISESDLSDGAMYFVKLAGSDNSNGSLLPVYSANPILKGTTTEGQSFLVIQTPEPLTLILLGAGLLGLAGLRRKE